MLAIGMLGLTCSEASSTARVGDRAAYDRGRALFSAHCAICHGEKADGRGHRTSNLSHKPTSFLDPSWRKGTNPDRIYAAVRDGKPGTPMASWRALSEQELNDLVTFVWKVGGR